jgi:hypothetical protein
MSTRPAMINSKRKFDVAVIPTFFRQRRRVLPRGGRAVTAMKAGSVSRSYLAGRWTGSHPKDPQYPIDLGVPVCPMRPEGLGHSEWVYSPLISLEILAAIICEWAWDGRRRQRLRPCFTRCAQPCFQDALPGLAGVAAALPGPLGHRVRPGSGGDRPGRVVSNRSPVDRPSRVVGVHAAVRAEPRPSADSSLRGVQSAPADHAVGAFTGGGREASN